MRWSPALEPESSWPGPIHPENSRQIFKISGYTKPGARAQETVEKLVPFQVAKTSHTQVCLIHLEWSGAVDEWMGGRHMNG